MNEEHVWMLYFATIAGMRFHPKNDETGASIDAKLYYAANIADEMMIQHRRRFGCQSSAQSSARQ